MILKLFNRRVILGVAVAVVLTGLTAIGALFYYLNSPEFTKRIQDTVVREIAKRTGATATLGSVNWSLKEQRFVFHDLTLRGQEPADGPPLAHIASIAAGINFRSLLDRHLDLSELTITRPEFLLLVDREGHTNLPPRPPQDESSSEFRVTIGDFRIVDGKANVNERRVDIDFALNDLKSTLNYQDAAGILSMDLSFDGMLNRPRAKSIPYTLRGKVDLTRGHLVAHQLEINSGKSAITAHGRIDDVFRREVKGKLEYAGNVEVPFLNYFLPKEKVSGKTDVAGFLEFSNGYFLTTGKASSARVGFDEWVATGLKTEYSYHHPGKRLALRRVSAQVLGGTAAGSVTIEPLPGSPRFKLDLEYSDIDSAQLAHVVPWDPKYKVYSRITGQIQGWFEERFSIFEVEGDASLSAYSPQPEPDKVTLPVDGTGHFLARPDYFEVRGGDGKIFSTAIQADGVIHKTASALTVSMTSANLADLSFIYAKANGAGSFNGTLTGPIKTPLLNGEIVLDGYKHEQWTLKHAEGKTSLDTQTENAVLRNVRVEFGQSHAIVNGTAKIDGSVVDLRIQTDNLRGEDVSTLTGRNIGGNFTGSLHLTSLDPLRFEDGKINANALVFEGRALGSAQANLRFDEPNLEVKNLRATERGATLTGDINYNRKTEALMFGVTLTALDLARLRDLGVPDTLNGILERATLTGSGTRSKPEIKGDGVLRDFTFRSETFPVVNLHLDGADWPHMIVTMENDRNLDLTANINVSEKTYPFEARASFKNYSIEDLAGFTQGTMVVTGSARFSGSLTDSKGIKGQGTIDSAQVQIPDHLIQASRPFTFSFDTTQLMLSKVSLTERQGTQLDLEGSVGLSSPARLDLTAEGSLDLSLLTASNPDWTANGMLTFIGDIGGTSRNPDLRGSAHISNASLEREGTYITLSALNGDAVFNGNRITLTDMEGRVGGGYVRIQGSGVYQNSRIEGMNIRIETDDVRFRYPEGLRTLLDGTLVLTGTQDSPLLSGNMQIQSLGYRNEFEEFLALFQPGSLDNSGGLLDRLRLSVRVTGNRDIRIQNQLADVEARVDLDIRGTAGRPTMIGHIEASGGTLLFQGNRYEITRGNIDFIDPLRIEPAIDIQAETELRDYRVILAVTGRGNRVQVNLSSDPPLPQLELIGLIAGGKTREELRTESGNASLPTSEELFKGGAASILFNQVIGQRFGLLGLDRVRIDPYLVGAGSNPSARITLSEQVTKDLSVTYSQDISSNQQRLIMVEYFLNKNLSIVASREETDETPALGLDIRLRKRF